VRRKNREIGVLKKMAGAAGERRDRAISARDAARAELKLVRTSLRETRSKERIASQKTVAARAQVRHLKTRVDSLERALGESLSETESVRRSYQSLRSRRSVRIAMRAASITGPIFRLVRGGRMRESSDEERA
jgi:hypothetical protein